MSIKRRKAVPTVMRNGIAIAVGIAVAAATASSTRQTSTEQCRVTSALTLSQEVSEETPESCSERVLGTTRIVMVMALVAAALARRKRHMIIPHDHMITRSPCTSAGASDKQSVKGWGYGSLEHRKTWPYPRAESFRLDKPWARMESNMDRPRIDPGSTPHRSWIVGVRRRPQDPE